MSEKRGKVIQKQELFSKKDKVLVGVSGGMDSMVLCDMLFSEGYTFIIAHCNYHLRGEDSDLDEELVKEWALEHNIPYFGKSCPISDKANIQEEARKMRYAYFEELYRIEECKYILTAHHQSDQIETFMLNLSRGAGLKGLKGMRKISGRVIRPLLDISRNEIYTYAMNNQVPFREDESNQETKYLRNFYRNEILPLISKRVTDFENMMLRSIQHLSEAEELLENIFEEWKSENVFNESGMLKISKPDSSKFYLLSRLLVEMGFHPETITQIKDNYSKSGKQFRDRNNHELLIDRNHLLIKTGINNKEAEPVYELAGESGELTFATNSFHWTTISKMNDLIKFSNELNEVFFDRSKLTFPLIIRKWQPGDYIRPLGMNGKKKKVQDVLTDHKIPVFQKHELYMMLSGDEVIWIPGIIRSQFATIDESTQKYLHVSRKHLK